ncbi:MAG: polysaccharide pyruvyl transferase family protein [Algibacter sp.]|uniref:polysaccharide pyruvyl transferase family protein n=1 Tax=Algibacter sp. TaxID=1872428 RepID=UPI003299B6A6
MSKRKKIQLFWWSESLLMEKDKENYGDVLGKYLVEKISKQNVSFVYPKRFRVFNFWQPIYVTAGSILAHVNKKCIVWGSGIITKNQEVKAAKFLAVRGPETRNALINQGYVVPEVFGDPALLLPDYYNPVITKTHKIGVIPHYVDYEFVKAKYGHLNNVLIIDLMTNNIEKTTNQILQCNYIMSSSLHGIIVSHTYNIPALWIKFSDKLFGDNIKFVDYFKSVEIAPYIPMANDVLLDNDALGKLFQKEEALPKQGVISKLKVGLMGVCPFK